MAAVLGGLGAHHGTLMVIGAAGCLWNLVPAMLIAGSRQSH